MIWSLKHVCDTVTNLIHETHKAQKSPKENQIMCQITYFFSKSASIKDSTQICLHKKRSNILPQLEEEETRAPRAKAAKNLLLNPQNPSPLPLTRLLALVALLKRRRLLQRPAEVVGLLDLVDADDPVLAGEGLLDGAELGAHGGQLGAADAVLGLAGGEERVVVVVGHLVHQAVLHGVGGLVVDAVFAAGGEEVAFFDFVGPDACGVLLVGLFVVAFVHHVICLPSAILTIQRNLLMSSPEYPRRPPKTTRT